MIFLFGRVDRCLQRPFLRRRRVVELRLCQLELGGGVLQLVLLDQILCLLQLALRRLSIGARHRRSDKYQAARNREHKKPAHEGPQMSSAAAIV